MKKSRSHMLIVDDDHITLDLLMEVLLREGYEVSVALSGEEAILKAQQIYFEVVITDIRMGNKDGMEVLRTFKRISPETIIIMITAFRAIDTAIEAIREGAFDYISKPFKLEEITLTVKKALEQKRLIEENKFYSEELIERYNFKNVIGRTPKMVQLYKTIAKVANTKSTVLLYGERGYRKGINSTCNTL